MVESSTGNLKKILNMYSIVDHLMSAMEKINSVYTYFATDTYPFFPRCFKGIVNTKFMKQN